MSGIAGVFKLPFYSSPNDVSDRLMHMMPRLRHRGKENVSVLINNCGRGFNYYRSLQHISRFSPINVEGDDTGFTDFYPRAGIAYVSRTAFQRETLDDIQPRFNIGNDHSNFHQSLGIFCDGELENGEELRAELQAKGAYFAGDTDTEILLRLIESICRDNYWVRGKTANYEDVFRKVERKIEGAINALILDGESSLVAYRSQRGGHPLEYMRTSDGFFLFASENCALRDLPGKFREVRPGHIKWIDGHTGDCTDRFVGDVRHAAKLSIYETLYMENGDTMMDGQTVSKLRYKIGHTMGKTMVPYARSIVARAGSLVVCSMPNGGIPYADGVYDALVEDMRDRIQRDEVINVMTTTRAAHGATDREEKIRAKYDIDWGRIGGKTFLTVDENLIEGTTNKVVTRMMNEGGAMAVHGAICSPPVVAPDYSGMGIHDVNKLAYWNIWKSASPHDRARMFPLDHSNLDVLDFVGERTAELTGAASLHFLPLGYLERALPGGSRRYDLSAFTLVMPTQSAQRRANENLQKLMS